MSSQPSFFASLFDFSFSRFVTLRLVMFLYVVSMILIVVAVVVLIFQIGIDETVSGVEVVGYIVLGPVLSFLYLLGIRIWFELVVVVFRIGETATEIRDLLSKSSLTGAVE